MTYHSKPSRRARGYRPNQDRGQDTSPRFTMSLPAAHLEALANMAQARDVPMATVIREAIDMYLENKSTGQLDVE